MNTKTNSENKNRLSFFGFLNTLKWLFVFNYKLSPWAAPIQIILRIFLDVSPLLNALIFAKLLDQIIKIITSPNSNINEIIPLLVILFLFNLLISALNSMYAYAASVVQTNLNNRSSIILAEHINCLGIQTLENPEIVNKIDRSRNLIGSFNNDLERMTMFISKIIVLISTSFIVIKIMPIITSIICVAMIPELISNRIHMRKDWEIWRRGTEGRRRANSASSTLTETVSLQEITITSSFGMLSNVFNNFMKGYIKEQVENSKSWQTWSFFLGSITDITSIFGYFSIFKNFFYKLISIGDVTFQMKTLDMFVNNMMTVGNVFSGLYERAIKINEVKIVFEMSPMIHDGNIKLPKFETTPNIKLENICFKYPGADKFVIKKLNLNIKPGEKIAIVGENGAGKTTLVKLLSRFYKVNEGNIYINDININQIEIKSWYKNLGVLFQEYNKYPYLSLKENNISWTIR